MDYPPEELDDEMAVAWLQVKRPSASATSAIDERKGRAVVRRRGVPIAGMAGVLLAAKQRGFINKVLPLVKGLEQIGYRMPPALVSEIARRAGVKRRMNDANLPQLVCQCLREAVSEIKTMSNFDTNSGMVFFMVSTLITAGNPTLLLTFRGL